eukprot:m.157527 g.157527  ORF g.157527 m.157527 type:complete len:56 (+) comp11729_c0_seq14:41-208(+)
MHSVAYGCDRPRRRRVSPTTSPSCESNHVATMVTQEARDLPIMYVRKAAVWSCTS